MKTERKIRAKKEDFERGLNYERTHLDELDDLDGKNNNMLYGIISLDIERLKTNIKLLKWVLDEKRE